MTQAELRLLVDLVPADAIGRLPDRVTESVLGEDFPVVAVTPFEASAPLKLRLALRQVTSGDGVAETPDEDPLGPGRIDGPRPVVLITGMSGAGRSVALRALEDSGYEAVDNLPLPLLEALLSAPLDSGRPIALGVDIRSRDFAAEPLLRQFDRLARNPDLRPSLVFVDCDDEVLMRRFKETRRRHPLAEDRPIGDGLAAERRMLAPLRNRAQVFIDTSAMTPAAFRRQLLGQLGLGPAAAMTVFVTSFSYRHGIPREADLVFDVRFLANPHYRDELRPTDGAGCGSAGLCGRRSWFYAFLRQFDRSAWTAAAALPRRGQELPDHCRRLHRRAPSLRNRGRATGYLGAEQGFSDTFGTSGFAPRSAAAGNPDLAATWL